MKILSFIAALVFCFSLKVSAFTADYLVPTNDPTLKLFNSFKIDIQCIVENKSILIKYSYPQELSGDLIEFTMRQSQFDPDLYFGSNSEMKCNSTSCTVHYYNLTYNEIALKNHLKEMGLKETDSEFNSRLQVAFANHSDPGGVFTDNPTDYCQK